MLFKDFLLKARQEGWATGHFNASELDHMKAIADACREVGSPCIIGFSEGERKHIGLAEAVALREVLKKEYNVPVFLNADHTKSVDLAKQAVNAGFDSVHIDLSAEPYEENAEGTREIVAYARAKSAGRRTEISVEGELGYLRGESKIQKEKIIVSPEDYTKPEEARKFAADTGAHRLAIAVGNIHGISLDEPALDILRIQEIRRLVPENVALVLHAASGIPEDKIKEAIGAGIANIHINTDIRVAYAEGFRKSMAEQAGEVAMYKLDAAAYAAMKDVVMRKLRLFGSVARI